MSEHFEPAHRSRLGVVLALAVLLGAIGQPFAGAAGLPVPHPPVAVAATPSPHPPIAGFDCPEELGTLKIVREEWTGDADLGEVYCQYERYRLGERGRLASIQARWSDPVACTPPGPDSTTTVLPAPTDEPPVTNVGTITEVERRAPGVMAWVYYRYSEFAEGGMVQVIAEAFLAEAARRSPPCPGASPSPRPDCVIRGTVTDAGLEPDWTSTRPGHPLRGVRVAVRDESSDVELAVGATDRSGIYELVVPLEDLAGLDPKLDPLVVRVRLAEAAHDPSRYAVFATDGLLPVVAEIDSSQFVSADCHEVVERDFALGEIPDDYDPIWPAAARWPDVAEIYDRIGRAFELADLLKIVPDNAPPLNVFSFCTDQVLFRNAAGRCGVLDAFFIGTGSATPDRKVLPSIGFGNLTSVALVPGWPDNREYHEAGHAMLADAFGNAIPRDPRDTNHDGYYRNVSSTDAWVEGFAEFFSMMVSKQVDGEAYPEVYSIGGGWADLELDYRPWLGKGWAEELALAGILLDLEDGDADYAAPQSQATLSVLWHALSTDWQGNRFVVGKVRNVTPASGSMRFAPYSEETMVAAVFYDAEGRQTHVAWGPTIPWDLPGEPARGAEVDWIEGQFVVAIPRDWTWDHMAVVAFEGRPGNVGHDDDPIDLDLNQLWDVIAAASSAAHDSNGYLFDVSELYAAVKARFGGQDNDHNGMDDVDQVFVAHGYFADANGDRSYRQRDPVGWSDHPGVGAFPAMIPRNDLQPFPGAWVKVDAGGVPVRVMVQVSLPDRPAYSYVAAPRDDGRVAVIPPPPGSGATVSLVALADGYTPALAGVIDPDAFWAAVETAPDDAPGPTFTVSLIRGTVGPAGGGGTGAAGGVLVLGGGLAALAAAGLLLLRRIRRAAPGRRP